MISQAITVSFSFLLVLKSRRNMLILKTCRFFLDVECMTSTRECLTCVAQVTRKLGNGKSELVIMQGLLYLRLVSSDTGCMTAIHECLTCVAQVTHKLGNRSFDLVIIQGLIYPQLVSEMDFQMYVGGTQVPKNYRYSPQSLIWEFEISYL